MRRRAGRALRAVGMTGLVLQVAASSTVLIVTAAGYDQLPPDLTIRLAR